MPDVLVPVGNAGQHAQLKLVEQPDGTHAVAAAVVSGGVGGGGGADREIVVTTYRATQNGTGYSVGNVISASRVLDVSGASATQVGATLWFNETTGLALAGAPTSGHLEVAGQPGLTDAQLRSAPLSVSEKALVRTALLTGATTTGAGAAVPDSGRAPSFTGNVSGTGAVSATVQIEARNTASGQWVLLGTLIMSGTTTAADGFGSLVRYMEYRANLTAISGASAAVTVTMGS